MMRRPRISLAIIAAALAAFAVLSALVFAAGPIGFDRRLVIDAGGLRTPSVDWLMVRLADLGAWFVLGPLTIVAAAALLVMRRPRAAVLVAAAVTGAEILQVVLKEVFARPRPELTRHLEHVTGAAYPSGHATVSLAFAAALCLVLWPASSRAGRIVLVALAAAYVLVIGFARVYLGVHYPSDVLAGWLLATAWVAAVDLALFAFWPADYRARRPRSSPGAER